ncbi:hypothetical protein Hypma_014802 [Hypsizygus marmoreus]|uniref:Uncharacterized protein n=1 Tax=Hypsizygus marmoreus TaxID=39966 RepID=A0A369K4G1_HYPMA|nr:hypothetical protein Hypma_014802 [Hypsizygus marmoreus]
MASTDVPKLTRFQLPGFGLPLNFIPCAESSEGPAKGEGRELFRNALNMWDIQDGYVQLPLTTLREFTMLHLMNELTDKPDWHKKVFDDTIAAKWKSEALATEGLDITQKMVDWCIDELRYKAKMFESTGAVIVYNGDVVKSDSAIPTSIKHALKEAVAPLEQVPARQQDWHPGSNERVLDLVHPSLFPLVYGRSRILPDSLVGLEDCIKRSGEGETIPVPLETEIELGSKLGYGHAPLTKPFSTQFQWLPCDVDISDKDSVNITSYINNLHPDKHKDLYSAIEKIIHHTIPIWNLTLTPLRAEHIFEGRVRINYHACEYNPDPENDPEIDGPQQEDDEDEGNFIQRRRQWYEDTRQVVQPEPGTFKPPVAPEDLHDEIYLPGTTELKPEKSTDLRRDYSHRGLQVIVKLANIHLTLEKPEYEGGTWHVEGQMNEHICATATYYYDSENITTSRLGFRQQSSVEESDEVDYRQDHHDWLEPVFGCQQNGPGIQDVGTVDTPEGRLLTWPNILQHQVQPFKLADPTKPGHRKILALFLVDPGIRIISTANVPCQQREWWTEVIQHEHSSISALPVELQDHIFEDIEDFPINLEEAKKLREKLMEERKHYVVEQDDAFKWHEFSLCEH